MVNGRRSILKACLVRLCAAADGEIDQKPKWLVVGRRVVERSYGRQRAAWIRRLSLRDTVVVELLLAGDSVASISVAS